MHTFQAHDSAIKALALDPCEEYFTTGSAEGNIKVSRYERCANVLLCLSSIKADWEGEPQQKTHHPLCVNTVWLLLPSLLPSVWFLLGPRKPDELSILSGH